MHLNLNTGAHQSISNGQIILRIYVCIYNTYTIHAMKTFRYFYMKKHLVLACFCGVRPNLKGWNWLENSSKIVGISIEKKKKKTEDVGITEREVINVFVGSIATSLWVPSQPVCGFICGLYREIVVLFFFRVQQKTSSKFCENFNFIQINQMSTEYILIVCIKISLSAHMSFKFNIFHRIN